MQKSVTLSSATGVALVLTPGNACHDWTIQNTGSQSCNLSYDGTAGINLSGQQGYLLASGGQITKTFTGSKAPPLVYGILTSAGSTTLQVTTDDTGST
jgi:hypothetical protein